MTPALLYLAALLAVAAAAAHSLLGERYILTRLFRRDLPRLFGGTDFTRRTLRFAWHVTSVAWLGFAAILVLLAESAATPLHVAHAIGWTFLATGLIVLLGSRGRHLAWPVFAAMAMIALTVTPA